MKEFFKKYSYNMIKLFITQMAVGLFGAVLAMATSTNDVLLWATGIGAAVFYLFLIYTSIWEVGAKDRISIDLGKAEKRPLTGFIIALIANIPNLAVASVYTVCWFVSRGAEGTATNVAGAMRIVTFIAEGMYYGIMTAVKIGANQLFTFWWAYYIITIPAIIVSGVAYILGTKNAKMTKIMDPVYPESDREPKKKFFSRKKDD